MTDARQKEHPPVFSSFSHRWETISIPVFADHQIASSSLTVDVSIKETLLCV